MGAQLTRFLHRLTLSQQFMLLCLAILLSGMVVIGWWVGRRIKEGVISRTAATTALYVDSFVAPHLQELGRSGALTHEHGGILSGLLEQTALGQHIVAFKVWDRSGRILYSTNPSAVGGPYPVQGRLARAFEGEVNSRISNLSEEENALERLRWRELLETYSPVRLAGTNQIIAVAEFYQAVDDLQQDIRGAQRKSWLLVGAATVAMYLLLVGMVRRGSNTIARQQIELSDKVTRLTTLLEQNRELHERVRRAATNTAELNERFLRRVSAELHDGPAQDLSVALLRLDGLGSRLEASSVLTGRSRQNQEDMESLQTSMSHALQELRTIAAGLRLPALEDLTVVETLTHAVRAHEKRSGTSVALSLDGMPQRVPLPVKITAYRVVQEALNNAYRHGGGIGQAVRAGTHAGYLSIQVSDQGPGFDLTHASQSPEHMGLAGMRERVEALGGSFTIESQPGSGTSLTASLPLLLKENDDA